MLVEPGQAIRPSQVAEWIGERTIRIRNIASSRESKAPGIGQSAERLLTELFRQFGHRPDGPVGAGNS